MLFLHMVCLTVASTCVDHGCGGRACEEEVDGRTTDAPTKFATRDVYYQKAKEHGNPIENKVVEGDRFKDYLEIHESELGRPGNDSQQQEQKKWSK
jgi:hypothetical protein